MNALIRIAETGFIPDALLRIGIKRLLRKRLKDEARRSDQGLSVADSAGGSPIAGVAVSGGGATASTDASGEYVLRASSANQVLVTYRASGYIPTVREVDIQDGSPTATHVELVIEAPAVPVDTTVGGLVPGERGSEAVLMPNTLVDSTGGSPGGGYQF